MDLIRETNTEGRSSLHYAVIHSKKDVQLLKFLIDNCNGDDMFGYTLLTWANSYNLHPIKKDIVALLRQYGGKANSHDKNRKRVGHVK